MKHTMIIYSHLAVAVLVFAGNSAYAGSFVADYNPSPPNINGVLGSGEWGSAHASTMDRADGGGRHDVGLHFQHDGTFLFIGIDSQWGSGWDVVWDLHFDGDHNKTRNGSLLQPYVDINICRPSPTGYPGYVAYRSLTGPEPGGQTRVGFSSGAASASGGSWNVFYEFRVPLADLDVDIVSGDTVGFIASHGYDGVAEHLYNLSAAGTYNSAEDWVTLQLAAAPEPGTVLLLTLGGMTLVRRRKRLQPLRD